MYDKTCCNIYGPSHGGFVLDDVFIVIDAGEVAVYDVVVFGIYELFDVVTTNFHCATICRCV
jgi:hypothetical protein